MKTLLKLSAAFLAAAVSQTSFAASANALFVRAGVAWFEPAGDSDFDGGAGPMAAFGADFGPHTVELEVSRVEFSDSAGPFSADLEIAPVMANYRYNFDVNEKFRVGLGGGVGLAFADLEISSPVASVSDDDTVWVVAFGVRAEYTLTAAVAITGGYRIAMIDDIDVFGVSIEDNDTHVIDVGVSYRW
jgi:opacity protein-like surface antigen